MRKSHKCYTAMIVVLVSLFLHACIRTEKPPKEANTSDESQGYGSESVYQTTAKWDDQKGDTLKLSNLSGKIPVVSMVFTRCTFSCPKTIAELKAIEKRLPSDQKDKVVFVLVSFDSDRDHTTQLQAFSREMQLSKNWRVLHGNPDDVRELSMLLDVKYKKQPNGDFTHSAGITVLDSKGVIVVRHEGLGNNPDETIKVIQSLLVKSDGKG